MRQTSYCRNLSTCCALSHLWLLAHRGSTHAGDTDLQTLSLLILGVSGLGEQGGGAGHTDPHRPSLPLGLCTPPVPSALAKCAPHGHDSAPSRWCHHAPYTQGCPTPGPATQTAGTAALALAEGSGSSQRGACGARRSEITAEVKETGARDGEAVRDHQKSLIRHTALFPWPRGVGDHSAHPISSQPFHMVVGLRSIPWLTPHPSSVLAP